MACGMPQERPDRRQTSIAAANTIAAGLFQIGQESQYPWGVQIVHAHGIRLDTVASLEELQEEAERVAVGVDGLRAQVALTDQV